MTYDQWKTTDPREYEREEEEQPSELDLAYEEIRRLCAVLAAQPQCAREGDFSHETFVTNNPDGSISLDAYAGRSREELKERCSELCSALSDWQFAAMHAATDGDNALQNVREPYRLQIAKLIEAYSDDDDDATVTRPDTGLELTQDYFRIRDADLERLLKAAHDACDLLAEALSTLPRPDSEDPT